MGTIRPQIVLFGDSLTEWSFRVDECGWGASLANHFSRKADVVARGFGGYNTRLAKIMLDRIFPIPSSNPPILVTVGFGANDSSDPNASHKILSVPVAEYGQNLRKIVTHLKKQSDTTKIILFTPPPVSEKMLVKQWLMWPDFSGIPTRRNEHTRLYAEEVVKVAWDEKLPVINLWSIFQEEADWEEKYLSDGLHLTSQGNAKVFEELLKVLEVISLNKKKVPWDFPAITRLGDNPVAALKTWCMRSSL
ncbi:unnamed protein product [Calypogeia fissa]